MAEISKTVKPNVTDVVKQNKKSWNSQAQKYQ